MNNGGYKNIKIMAEKLVSHGYVVPTVELYNGSAYYPALQIMSSFYCEAKIVNMKSAVSSLLDNNDSNAT